MTPLDNEDILEVNRTTPPRCNAADDILAMKSLTPHDKVKQFVEEQERQQQQQQQQQIPLTFDLTDITLSEDIQDAAFLTNFSPLTNDKEEENNNNIEIPPVELNIKPKESKDRKRKSMNKPEQKKQQISRKRKHHHEEDGNMNNESLLLFRKSQKALRKEARHINMKEVLCRSLSGVGEAMSEVSNPFSPTGASQSSSAWSPSIANSITNQFLSNVKQQKKQTFERLMQKELTNSQLSFSKLNTEDDDDDDNSSRESSLELVIGDETAIMEPPNMENDFLRKETSETNLNIDNNNNNNLFTVSNTSRSFIEINEEAEQAQSEALMRKHELWRLRQKHLKAQLRAEEIISLPKKMDNSLINSHNDSNLTSNVNSFTTTTTTTSTSTSTSTNNNTIGSSFSSTTTMNNINNNIITTSNTSKIINTSVRTSGVDIDGSFDVLMVGQCNMIQRTKSAPLGLSADHIEMIRRVNSFDNTSSQRVVVFETRSSQQNNVNESSSSSYNRKNII